MSLFKENKIYCGDNLDVMRGIVDESIDLIYLDPYFLVIIIMKLSGETMKKYGVLVIDGQEELIIILNGW